MKRIAILHLSLVQLLRSPGRLAALLLLFGCTMLALRTGEQELRTRRERIAAIEADRAEERTKVLGWFAEGKKGPEDMEWVDISEPYWCSWYARPKAILEPSPLLAIAPGRSVDSPWFMDLAYFSTGYSTELAAEISDPEHRQLGTFEWVFVLIYLMPLFLLALVFDVGGSERDRGALSLIELHAGDIRVWTAWRFLVPVLGVWLVTLVPMLFTAVTVGAFEEQIRGVLLIAALATGYVIFWAVLFILAAWMARGSNDQALRGAIAYAMLCLLLPGAVQWAVKLQHPPSLMLGYITADRIGSRAVYELEADTITSRFYALNPELRETPHGRDTVPNESIDWMMSSALVSMMMDSVVKDIVFEEQLRLKAMERGSWWLPCLGIPLAIERVARTDAGAHLAFRIQVQERGKAILSTIIDDSWNRRQMGEEDFKRYATEL